MGSRWVGLLRVLIVLFFTGFTFLFAAMTLEGFRQAGPAAFENPGTEELSNPKEATRRSFSEMLLELASLEVAVLRPSWELDTGGGETCMTLHEGNLYISSSSGTSSGMLYCVDAASGMVRWSRDLGAWISAQPAVWNGIVYVGTTGHVLCALDADSGALLWFFPAQGEILSTPVISDGVLFFFADNNSVFGLSNRLYALDARNGAQLWFYDTTSWTPSPPATDERSVFIGGSTSMVLALDKRTGREIWSRRVESVVFSSPCLADGKVYVITVNGRLYALDAYTGDLVWQRNMSQFTPSSPLLAGGNLYLDRCPDRVLALALEDGHTRWSMGGGALLAETASLSDDFVFTYYPQGRLFKLEAATGRRVCIYLSPFDFSRPPYVGEGRVFFVSSGGIVHACLLNGDISWAQ